MLRGKPGCLELVVVGGGECVRKRERDKEREREREGKTERV